MNALSNSEPKHEAGSNQELLAANPKYFQNDLFHEQNQKKTTKLNDSKHGPHAHQHQLTKNC
jgi:hypothetical protein